MAGRIIIGKDSSITYDFPVGKSDSSICWGPKFINGGKTILVNSEVSERLQPIHCKSKEAAKDLFKKLSGVGIETLPNFKKRASPCSCRRSRYSRRPIGKPLDVLNFRDSKSTLSYLACRRCGGQITGRPKR